MNMQQMQELKKLRELVAELVKRVEILENQVQSTQQRPVLSRKRHAE